MFEDVIRYWAEATPGAPAFVLPSGNISFRDFDRAIVATAQALHTEGLQRGGRVLVSDNRPFFHWVELFALDRIGCVSVSEDNMGFSVQVTDIDCVISNAPWTGNARRVVSTAGDWLARALRAGVQDRGLARTSPDDPVRIVLSSGTTGQPKESLYTRRIIDLRATRRAYLRPNDRTRFATAMGINTAGGFVTPISTWLSGGSVVYGGDAGMLDCLGLGANFLFLSPSQLQQLVRSAPRAGLNDGKLQILVAGGRLPAALADQVHAILTPRLELLYGSTEVGYVTRAYRTGSSVPDGFAGHIHPWAELQIVDEEDQLLPAGIEGIIRVRSDEMAGSYLGSPSNDRAGYRNGWHYPGDVGQLRSDGSLIVSGRSNEVVNVGGLKLSLVHLEEQLLMPGILDAAVTSLPNRLGVDELVAAVVAQDAVSLSRVYERARGLAHTRLKVVQVAGVPRNGMGKVMRNELRTLVSDPTAILAMIPNDVPTGGPLVA